MPKYVYQCDSCESQFEIYHGMSEDVDICPQCDSKGLHRVPQMPFLKGSVESKGSKVGDETKAVIEANREVLKRMKKERDFYRDDN